MSVTQTARAAVAAVLHAGEGKVRLPPEVEDFLRFMSDGYRQWSGAPLPDEQAVNCVLSEMWNAVDNGKIERGAEVTLQVSGKSALFYKSGFLGYSIVRLTTGEFRICRDEWIQLLNTGVDAKSSRRGPHPAVAKTG